MWSFHPCSINFFQAVVKLLVWTFIHLLWNNQSLHLSNVKAGKCILKLGTLSTNNPFIVQGHIPVCGDGEVWITWRGQLLEMTGTATNQCSRRDAGIVRKVTRLVPCTSSRTCSARDGIHSHLRGCTARGKP